MGQLHGCTKDLNPFYADGSTQKWCYPTVSSDWWEAGSAGHFVLTLPDDLPPLVQSTVVSPSARVNSLVDGPLVGTTADYKPNQTKPLSTFKLPLRGSEPLQICT
jgi:hypothetical protein